MTPLVHGAFAPFIDDPRWVAYNDKKWPVNPHTGRMGSTTDRRTWGTYALAVDAMRRYQLPGIGIVLGDGLAGIDLDHIAPGGDPHPWAVELIAKCGSYAEWSPSGEGIHILALVTEERKGRELLDYPAPGMNVEAYTTGRFFTVTGRQVEGSADSIGDANQVIAELYNEMGRVKSERGRARQSVPAASGRSLGHEMIPYVREAVACEVEEVAAAPRGGRNNRLNRAAFALGQLVGSGVLNEATAIAELHRAAAACGLPRAEAEATIRSGLTAGRAEPRDLSNLAGHPGGNGRKRAQEAPGAVGAAAGYPDTPDAAEDRPAAVADHCTDLAMADRLVARYAADLRFVPGRGWHYWDGRRWAPDEALTVERLADETARAVWREVGQADGRAERDRLIRFATRACSRRGQEAMVALARHRPEVLVVRDTLDADPWLLNTLDGTVDLRTGELRPHDRVDLVTRLAPTAWDPAGGCAAWLAFLNRVLPDPAVRAYVARLIGYSITGLTTERVFVCCFGPTASGKSTFAATLRAVLGDYAGTVSVGALTRSPNSCMDDERAAVEFDGPRLLFGSEAENGSRWRMNVLKRVAGGADEVTARPLHCETYRFRPQCTVWLMTNELPHADPGDGAFWARCQTIPFSVSIPEDERDPHLPDRLVAEAPGILQWAIQGCLEWQSEGLQPPALVRAAGADYREREDAVGQFLAECTERDPQAEVSAADLYVSYRGWCDASGLRPVAKPVFGRRLRAHGLASSHRRSGEYWVGVALSGEERREGCEG